MVHEVIRNGFLDAHVPTVRTRYRERRDAMRVALETHLPEGCLWVVPQGGMFFWVELPEACDSMALLPAAVARGMAFVPGEAFYAGTAKKNTLRLSFVTVSPAQIELGVSILAGVVAKALSTHPSTDLRAAA